jgi:hypothetical protein
MDHFKSNSNNNNKKKNDVHAVNQKYMNIIEEYRLIQKEKNQLDVEVEGEGGVELEVQSIKTNC